MNARRPIAFRTSAGKGVGFGHLRRCLTLAEELVARGASVVFWIDGDEAALEVARASGLPTVACSGDEPAQTLALVAEARPRALVVDSYGFDSAKLAALGETSGDLFVIDDLADRRLDGCVVVNGNADAHERRYDPGSHCRLLLGPRFALLRRSYRDAPPRRVPAEVGRVLITLGGADPNGQTDRVALQTAEALPNARVDVVIGPLFGATRAVEAAARAFPGRVTLHRPAGDLADLMRAADLAVSSGGQTTLELAAQGLPAVGLCLADNQRGNLRALAALPTLVDLGDAADALATGRVGEEVARLAQDREQRQRMSDAGRAYIDGRGAERVADAILDGREAT